MPYWTANPLTQLPPRAPSVLIRASRYVALGLGIAYGTLRIGPFAHWKKEKKIQEENAKLFEYIEARKAENELENSIRALIATKRAFLMLPELDEAQMLKEIKPFKKTKIYIPHDAPDAKL